MKFVGHVKSHQYLVLAFIVADVFYNLWDNDRCKYVQPLQKYSLR